MVFCGLAPIAGVVCIISSRIDILNMADGARRGDYSFKDSYLVTYLGLSRQQLMNIEFQVYAARILEALMFVVCYATMRTIANKSWWDALQGHQVYSDSDHTSTNASYAIGICIYYVSLYLFVGYYIVPEAVTSAAVVFAMPPYLDHRNMVLAKGCVNHAHIKALALHEENSPKAEALVSGVEIEVGGRGCL